MEKYQESLAHALTEVRIFNNDLVSELPEDRALVRLELPENEAFADGNWMLMLISVDFDRIGERIRLMMDESSEYRQAFSELREIWSQTAEEEPEPSLEEAKAAFIDMAAEILTAYAKEKMGITENAETAPEPLPTPELEEEKTGFSLPPELKEWIQKYFSDLIFQSTVGAGQDGRTIWMASRPGLAIPILFRLEMNDSGTAPKTGSLVIYTMGRWIDLGAMLDALTHPDEMEARLDEWVNSFDFTEFFGMLMDWQNTFFCQLPGGVETVIPSTGLEHVTIIDPEKIFQFPVSPGE